MAAADRELQLKEEVRERHDLLRSLQTESKRAIREVEENPHIRRADKTRIIRRLTETYALAADHEEKSRRRESVLEVMSLLGVVAGFMTHEFGVAVRALQDAERQLSTLSKRDAGFQPSKDQITRCIRELREFATYSRGYVEGAQGWPTKFYLAGPRIRQIIRVFGNYAKEREIDVRLDVDANLSAPLVPVSLYNGLALNLFTNALKAVAMKAGSGPREIRFKAWNENHWHHLEVVDTGVGIPSAMWDRVFDPLFTTTASSHGPWGSGMGLGLTLVRRGVMAFGGTVGVVEPPSGFSTCVRVRLPIGDDTK